MPVDAGDGEPGLAVPGDECRDPRSCPPVMASSGELASGSNSRNLATCFFSRMPASAFASETLCAASICSATRLFGCFVLSRIRVPRQVNLYHQFFEPSQNAAAVRLVQRIFTAREKFAVPVVIAREACPRVARGRQCLSARPEHKGIVIQAALNFDPIPWRMSGMRCHTRPGLVAPVCHTPKMGLNA